MIAPPIAYQLLDALAKELEAKSSTQILRTTSFRQATAVPQDLSVSALSLRARIASSE